MFYRYVSFCSEQTVNYFIFRRAFPFLKPHIAVVTLHSIILKKEIYFRQIQEEFIYLIPRVTKKKKKKSRKVTFLKPKFFGGSKREGMVPAKLSLRKRALKFQSLLISQACFSSETLKMLGFLSFVFFRVCVLIGRHGPRHS